MTLVGVNVRRTLMLLLSVVLLFGATTVIASQSADAAYPGGNEWIVFVDSDAPAHIWAIRADGSDLTQLTSTLNFDADPAFSADGTQVAFARDVAGSSAIYVADFLGGDTATPSLGTPTQVSAGTIDGSPTWSPDGTKVAYQRRIVSTMSSGTATLPADATGVVLTDTGANFVGDGVAVGDTVRNTTDGSSALVTGRTGTTVTMAAGLAGGADNEWAENDAYTIERSNRQIFWSPTNGTNLPGTLLSPVGSQLLYTDQEPVWSPDGTKIAFTSTQAASNSDIYTMSATDGSSRTNLTVDGGFDFDFDNVASHPAWSPDGSRIAFQIGEEMGQSTADNLNIWTISSSGGSSINVTTDGDNELEPAWSPDGSLIAFRKADTGASKIFAIASDGSGAATRVGSEATPAANNKPDWQPVLAGVDDAAAVDEDGSVNVDVLANDLVLVSDVGAATTSATLVTEPTKGTAVRQGDGSFTYTHTGPEIGLSSTTDTFEYTVTQGSFTSTAEVTVTINPVDNDPTADTDEYAVDHASTLNVGAAEGVLNGDEDPEGLGLSAVLVDDATKGTLALAANGSFTYTHDGVSTDATTDTFTYQAEDPGGNKSPVTTVTINIGAENPDPPSITVQGPTFGAVGIEATFSATVVDGSGPRVYDWSIMRSGAEVASGSSATIDFTPTLTGLHTVELSLSDSAGVDTDTLEFTVMTDITGNTFAANIVWLANEGITKGCNPPVNDEYCPNDRVTRGQMAAFLVRFLDLTDDGGGDLFTDDDGSIFESNIDKLATAGITLGCNPPTNDNFCPNDFVTRGQMAAFLVRALNLTDDGGGDLFTDDDGSIFESNIDKLATAGITRGCNPPTNDLFCPDDFVTRGQMAAFLNRADDLK
ncbi:MAG: Ig-like domain-containing protein [Acidimicrobiia bacterium]|nr:Ig-like domain-containing protein [Acidimicrobiia bacterium]